MLEDLKTFHGLVLDRCGAVGADALDSDLRVGDGCVRLGAADHTVVVGDEIEHVPLLNERDLDGHQDIRNMITTTDLQQEDEQLEAVLFNLLEEASVEDHFNRM